MAEPMEPTAPAHREPVEALPVVVLSRTFTARPSSIPDIREFVRHCLADSPLTEEDNRAVSQTVFRALLDAAGPTGTIQVSFRIFPEHVEVDVLHSTDPIPQVVGAVPATRRDPDTKKKSAAKKLRHKATLQQMLEEKG